MVQQADKNIAIRKASGETEPFDVVKLKRSLQNAGAQNTVIEEIAADIEGWIHEGATTKKIYSRAFLLLKRKNRISAIHYKLKQALLELGPTGYPFEHFVGEIFRQQGYETAVGQHVEGLCISHEMDVVASNKNEQRFIECKYAVDQGKLVSIQIPLYVSARIDDIIQKRKEMPEFRHLAFSGCLVTNTRFSSDSKKYSTCRYLELIGWDYPKGNGLKELIKKNGVFPITVLDHLTKTEKQLLMNKGIVTCSQVLLNIKLIETFGLSKHKYRNLLSELEDICGAEFKSGT